MAKMFQVYGIGQALIPVLPPPIPFQNAPTSNQTNYEIGQVVYSPAPIPTAFYIYGGAGNWIKISDVNGPVQSVTGTANQILATPTSGDVVLSLIGPYTPATYTAHGVLIGAGTSSIVATATGTAGQVLTSGGAAADPTWTTATFPATAAAGDILVATAANVIGSLADVAVGQVLVSGGVGVVPAYTASPSVTGSVTAGTGVNVTTGGILVSGGDIINSHGSVGADITIEVTNTDNTNAASRAGVEIATGGASSGDPYLSFQISGVGASTMTMGLDNSASDLFVISNSTDLGTSNALSLSQAGALTATTTLTATLGDITATNGNLVASTAGNGISLPVTTASGAAGGTVNCNGRAGSVTFTSVSIASNADLTLTLGNTSIAGASTRLLFSMSGATTGSALSVKSVTPGTGTYAWVVTNGDGAAIVTSVADITFDFIVLN